MSSLWSQAVLGSRLSLAWPRQVEPSTSPVEMQDEGRTGGKGESQEKERQREGQGTYFNSGRLGKQKPGRAEVSLRPE